MNNNRIEANDNDDSHNAHQPETERQELLRLRREHELQRQVLLQERAQLLLEIQQERILLERARLVQERVPLEQQHVVQGDVDAVMIARWQHLPQVRAFETHVLALETQQQRHPAEEGTECDTDEAT